MNKQDFKKFAADLISPSELFEPHRERNHASVQESIDLLGSLATLTRSSLLAATVHVVESNQHLKPTTTSAPSVQYQTSRTEYQQALSDQRIAQALAALQTHRENPVKSRTIIRAGEDLNSPFKALPVPSLNVSVKKTNLTSNQRRPSECQPILRENDPSSY